MDQAFLASLLNDFILIDNTIYPSGYDLTLGPEDQGYVAPTFAVRWNAEAAALHGFNSREEVAQALGIDILGNSQERFIATPPPAHLPTQRVVAAAPVLTVNGLEQRWEIVLAEPQWAEFAQALKTSPAVNALYASAPTLVCHELTAALVLLLTGDLGPFSRAWAMLRRTNLLTLELAAVVQTLAGQHNLPSEFIASLRPRRARNPDGTFRADDPATPDVDEAWEL